MRERYVGIYTRFSIQQFWQKRDAGASLGQTLPLLTEYVECSSICLRIGTVRSLREPDPAYIFAFFSSLMNTERASTSINIWQ